MYNRRSTVAIAAVVMALAIGAAACSSTGGKPKSVSTGGSGGGGQVATTPKYTIAMITHETPGDTFWDKIRAGAKAAAAKDNITLKYSSDPDPSKQATLVQQAVDSKVDGIAVTLATPPPLKPAVQAAVKAGIPVVAFNSGISAYKSEGAMEYFGSDENLAGLTAGQKLTAAGETHPLCVIQQAGSVALEARCAGVKKGDPGSVNLQVNGADDSSVVQTLTAKLQSDKSIDVIVTLGAQQAIDALQAITAAHSTAHVITFDLNATVAQDIQSGKIDFSIDQQPYLQGYEAVDSLWLYLTNRNVLGGGLPVLTGPSIVDKSNIGAIVKYAEAGTR